jgi:hypothetical protein
VLFSPYNENILSTTLTDTGIITVTPFRIQNVDSISRDIDAVTTTTSRLQQPGVIVDEVATINTKPKRIRVLGAVHKDTDTITTSTTRIQKPTFSVNNNDSVTTITDRQQLLKTSIVDSDTFVVSLSTISPNTFSALHIYNVLGRFSINNNVEGDFETTYNITMDTTE